MQPSLMQSITCVTNCCVDQTIDKIVCSAHEQKAKQPKVNLDRKSASESPLQPHHRLLAPGMTMETLSSRQADQ
jgi:hypothetical protein